MKIFPGAWYTDDYRWKLYVLWEGKSILVDTNDRRPLCEHARVVRLEEGREIMQMLDESRQAR